MDNNTLWNNILDTIKKELSPMSFNTWFKDTTLINLTDTKATIKVPMQIHKKLLGENYYDMIENLFLDFTGKNYELEYISQDEIETNEEILEVPKTISNEIDDKNFNSNLIEKYTFDNFVIGESNRFAQTAALAVAQNPGKIYNPLFIHGRSGLGKTHLMHAIGNYVVNNLHKTVLYITSDDFISDFTNLSNRNGENNFDYAEKFKEKYRNIDVLLIDDIQFLAGAEKTQREFFHTFNALYSANKQIVITSDRPPDDLKVLEERLRTRFAWGLTTDIYPPDIELKTHILKNKINGHQVAKMIDDDVINFMACSCENDVRHLEGAITRLYAYAAINSQNKIDLTFAQEALKDFINKSIYFKNDISKIQNAVAESYNITIEDLKSKKRSNNIAYPRQVGMYLSRMLTDESLQKIGLEFGNRDHSTVLHAYEKINKDLINNKQLKEIINDIKDKIM
ncbi:MAG TPA: chromosomal replication initiator protein DnaA [Bacilli bacterium]|nr:chromosomal replication initiator protein DnaA [Bacilli bacterium]